MRHFYSVLVLMILGIGAPSKKVRADCHLESPPNYGFIDFYVCMDGEVASLYWTMKPNSDLVSVRIEKSKNRKRFNQLTNIDISGNNNALTEYQEIDSKPWRGTTYYRLMAIGLDDSCYYSMISTVKFNKRKPTFEDGKPLGKLGALFKETPDKILDTHGEVLVVVRDINGVESFSKVTITGIDGRIITVIDEHEELAPGTYRVTGSSDDRLNACRIRVESVIAIKNK